MAFDASVFGESAQGNFRVIDTIGVPHPYMIGARHVAIASDRFSGMLGKEAIEAAEKEGVTCGICKGKFTFAQHETALLISCHADMREGDNMNPELHEYLLMLKGLIEAMKKDGTADYVGFAFKDDR